MGCIRIMEKRNLASNNAIKCTGNMNAFLFSSPPRLGRIANYKASLCDDATRRDVQEEQWPCVVNVIPRKRTTWINTDDDRPTWTERDGILKPRTHQPPYKLGRRRRRLVWASPENRYKCQEIDLLLIHLIQGEGAGL